MAQKKQTQSKSPIPGILIECESGSYIAYYEHRTDIIANGENEKDAIDNLRDLYAIVMAAEDEEKEEEKKTLKLPSDFKVKHFKDNTISI